MSSGDVHTLVADFVSECWKVKGKARRISVLSVRRKCNMPNTPEGLAQARQEIVKAMETLETAGMVAWFKVMPVKEGGPEWVVFMLPPYKLRSKGVH